MKIIELKAKELFNKALILRDKGEYEEAIDLLHKIILEHPDFSFAYGHLGEILWKQGNLQEANHYFLKASELMPESSLASLCVFHTLWEMEKYEPALLEIKRFKKIGRKSKDYEEIISGLIKKKMIDENLNLI